MMTRRMTIGLVAGLTGALLAGAGAVAFAHGGRAAHAAIMKRMVSAHIDEAIDSVRATPEQRAAIHAARDRVFAAFEEQRRSRGARMQEILALFEADQVDPARVDALRRQGDEEHARLRDAMVQAVTDVHGVLSPDQRKLLADYVRRHRPHA
jgi:Spy/CpxP family protein refolding chaperone